MLVIAIPMHACTGLIPRPPPVHSIQIQRRRYRHWINFHFTFTHLWHPNNRQYCACLV